MIEEAYYEFVGYVTGFDFKKKTWMETEHVGGLVLGRKQYYDQKGNMIRRESYVFGSVKWITDYSYDNLDNVIREIGYLVIPGEGSKRTSPDFFYDYEYDENGNWTKRIQYRPRKDGSYHPKKITVRAIEYYEDKEDSAVGKTE